ncbi:MAG TPA: response regulator [Thermoclostridium sp.]
MLVVEDEDVIRRNIVNFIKRFSTDFEVVGDAENGLRALEIYNENEPDIVITDILMPQMDGIQLIEKLRQDNREIAFIIISGYDEFAYAQSAMRLNVFDYLLKPFLPQQLADVLLKVKESIDRRRNFFNNIKVLQSKLEESMPILRERFFIDLVTNQLSFNEILQRSSFLQLDISADFYNVAIVKINASEVSKSRNITKEELIHFFLFDIVGELFDSNIKTFAFGISDYQLGIIMCGCYEYKRQFFQNINKSLSKLIETMANYYHVTIFAAVGRIYEDILKLPLSFAEAKEAMTYSFAIEANTLINYYDIFLKKTETYEKPSSILKEIILYTKTGDSDKALKKIENLFEYYKGKAVLNPNLIKADVIEVVLAIQRYLEESKGDDTFLYNQNISPYEKIVKADSVSDLKGLLHDFAIMTINEVVHLKEGQSNSFVEKLKSITEENIGNEDFNLDIAASMLYISPNYLRQMFKKVTGETFIEYLTNQRMKKAAELLRDNSLKISDITEQVGYSSQSYFTKCFKKYYNVTPTEYRENIMNGSA